VKTKYSLNNIASLDIKIHKPSIIFLKGDLWAGKTTLSQHIIGNLLRVWSHITSPTYTYYNQYNDIYHFDLYRLKSYDEFFAIGWEDIFDNNSGVILVEWPEIIEKHYHCDIEITLKKNWKNDERELEVSYK
jgi:tRNA threonylcarbamoyladenosine biosynthesis protein TsaE